jgi:hypothetical protein
VDPFWGGRSAVSCGLRAACIRCAARTGPEISDLKICFRPNCPRNPTKAAGRVARGVHAARTTTGRVEARLFRAPRPRRETHGATPATKRYKLLPRGRVVRGRWRASVRPGNLSIRSRRVAWREDVCTSCSSPQFRPARFRRAKVEARIPLLLVRTGVVARVGRTPKSRLDSLV